MAPHDAGLRHYLVELLPQQPHLLLGIIIAAAAAVRAAAAGRAAAAAVLLLPLLLRRVEPPFQEHHLEMTWHIRIGPLHHSEVTVDAAAAAPRRAAVPGAPT